MSAPSPNHDECYIKKYFDFALTCKPTETKTAGNKFTTLSNKCFSEIKKTLLGAGKIAYKSGLASKTSKKDVSDIGLFETPASKSSTFSSFGHALSSLGNVIPVFGGQPSETNLHIVINLDKNVSNENVICLDKTHLTSIYTPSKLMGLRGKGDAVVVGKFEKCFVAAIYEKYTSNGGITFHYTENHPDVMYIIHKDDQTNFVIKYFKVKLDSAKKPTTEVVDYDESIIQWYGSSTGGVSLTKVDVGKPFVVNPIEGQDGCFTVKAPVVASGGGGRRRGVVNARAKAMHKIPLTLRRPDMFIIGRYAHPRAPFIVLPLMQSWVHGEEIWFKLGAGAGRLIAGANRLIAVKRGRRLTVDTGGGTYDLFLIKHMVKLQKCGAEQRGAGQRGGATGDMHMVFEGETTDGNTKMCVAEKVIFLKEIIDNRTPTTPNNIYINGTTQGRLFIESNSPYIYIDNLTIPFYNLKDGIPEQIQVFVRNKKYILAVGTL